MTFSRHKMEVLCSDVRGSNNYFSGQEIASNRSSTVIYHRPTTFISISSCKQKERDSKMYYNAPSRLQTSISGSIPVVKTVSVNCCKNSEAVIDRNQLPFSSKYTTKSRNNNNSKRSDAASGGMTSKSTFSNCKSGSIENDKRENGRKLNKPICCSSLPVDYSSSYYKQTLAKNPVNNVSAVIKSKNANRNNNNCHSTVQKAKQTEEEKVQRGRKTSSSRHDMSKYNHETAAATGLLIHRCDDVFDGGQITAKSIHKAATNSPANIQPTPIILQSNKLRPAKSETSLRQKQPHQKRSSRSAMLTDDEIFQIELMYSAQATKLTVCSCMANIYVGQAQLQINREVKGPVKASDWQLLATGVPLLVLDYGQTATRLKRRIQLILAEKGTGFTLWKDNIDSLTKYTEVGSSFHTMLLSSNHQRMAGLSFDSPYSAMQFYRCLDQMISIPENVALSPNNSANNNAYIKKSRRHSFTKSALRKSEISYPCCFNHVTSLKAHQMGNDGRPKRSRSCFEIADSEQLDAQKLPSPASSF